MEVYANMAVIAFFIELGEAFLIMGGVYVLGHVMQKLFVKGE